MLKLHEVVSTVLLRNELRLADPREAVDSEELVDLYAELGWMYFCRGEGERGDRAVMRMRFEGLEQLISQFCGIDSI